jgi:hypothetical protein
MQTLELETQMRLQGLTVWDAPWETRQEAGRKDLKNLGALRAIRTLMNTGWNQGVAADWLLEAALGAEMEGRIVLLPFDCLWFNEDQAPIDKTEEAFLRLHANRHHG